MYKPKVSKYILIFGITIIIVISTLIVVKIGQILPSESISGVDRFRLNQKELESLQKQANDGSVEAAKRVRDYYAFVLLNDKQTLYWAKKAVELGDKDSKEMVEYYEKVKKVK